MSRFGMALWVLIAAMICNSCGPSLPPITETISHPWDMQERLHVVEGKPLFTLAGQSVILDLRTKPHYALPSLVWPEELLPHRNLEGLSGLRFELVEEVRRVDDKWQSGTTMLRRVWQADKLLLDTTPRCEVHHVRMRREVEDGTDGGELPDRFDRRRKQLFPNDGKAYLLCGSFLSGFVWTCPDCVRVQKREYKVYYPK